MIYFLVVLAVILTIHFKTSGFVLHFDLVWNASVSCPHNRVIHLFMLNTFVSDS